MSPERHSPILRASVVSATGTGLARVLGALRDVVLSHVFGAGRASDAFWLAWTVPSIFRRFVADEGLTGALIPAVGQAEREEGTAGARRLAGAALSALLLAGAVICVGGVLAAPWLVKVFAYGFTSDPAKFELTVTLTRWLFPFVVFVSLVSYCEALLNYKGHFFVPKVAPGVVSGCIAAAALLLSSRFEEPVYSLVVGALVGGLVHFLICLPSLVTRWGAQMPSLSALRTPRFRRLLGEMGKVVAIGVVAPGQRRASASDRLVPRRRVGYAVLVRGPGRRSDPGQRWRWASAARSCRSSRGMPRRGAGTSSARISPKRCISWRLVLLPAAALLLGLAPAIVSILFRHGAFDAAAAARTSATLQMLVPFMLALAGINILKKAFFALDDRTSLLAVGAIGLVFTAGLGYPLARQLGVQGLGLSLSLSASLQLVAYLAILRRKMGTRLRTGVSSSSRS